MPLMGLLKEYQDDVNSFGMGDSPLSIESYVEGTPLAEADAALLAVEAENPVLDSEMGAMGPQLDAGGLGGMPMDPGLGDPLSGAPEAPMGLGEEPVESDQVNKDMANSLLAQAQQRANMSQDFQARTAKFNAGDDSDSLPPQGGGMGGGYGIG